MAPDSRLNAGSKAFVGRLALPWLREAFPWEKCRSFMCVSTGYEMRPCEGLKKPTRALDSSAAFIQVRTASLADGS
jgi:hypothetical protein